MKSELELNSNITQLLTISKDTNQTINNNTEHHSLNSTLHQLNHKQQAAYSCITDTQLDKLNLLIKIIKTGNYKEFLQMLEKKGLNNLLNVFVDGQTALHYSLIYGRSLAWCKQLILNGANPNLTNQAGWHPIHLAAFNGSRETMRYLVDCIVN